MKINEDKMKEAQAKALQILNDMEDKSQAVIKACEILNEANYEDLITELKEQAERADTDKVFEKSLGLRTLSKVEKEFYTKIQNIKNAVSGAQIDLIPTSIIDLTLEDIRTSNPVLEDINFAPASVKKWLVGEKSGTFGWGELSEALVEQLTAGLDSLSTDVNKLYAVLIIPKGISDLGLQYVDKYFMAILKEALNDGLEYGYFQGNGKKQPIGIYKQIDSVNEDGTHKDKLVHTDLIDFSPKGLKTAKTYLNKSGKRTLKKLVVYCNPNDKANYIEPAIYNEKGELISSFKNLEIKDSIQNPEGKAALAIPKKYTMGLTGFDINKYKETKALDDADVLIGKGYANGRAADDNTAYIFDVTKLVEYIEKVKVVGTVETKSLEEKAEKEEEGA